MPETAENSIFKPVALSKAQLAAMYKVSCKTFRSWLSGINDIGEYKGKAYTPAQVQKITQHLGNP
jgi:hypothetical protein